MMKTIHKLRETDIKLENAISHHSADKCIAYKTVHDEPVYLGYYFPKDYDSGKTYPTFLLIHGGGWAGHTVFEDQLQWQGDHLGYLARYYADKGFVCVSIDYRLTRDNGQEQDYGILECYEDCCDAVDYVLKHAKEYGTDTSNLYLLGESAGGHLAGAVATFHYDRQYAFRKVFLINPITDLHDEKWKKMVPKQSTHEKLEHLSYNERIEFLSPLCQVDEHIGNVVLIHGEADEFVSLENSTLFYREMCHLSKECDLHIMEKTNHAFLLAEYYEYGLEACKMAIEIISKSLSEVGETKI